MTKKIKKISNKNLAIIGATVAVVGFASLMIAKTGSKSTDNSEDKAKQDNSVESMMEAKAVASGIDPDKKIENAKDVEEVVSKWVENNPQFIISAVMKMQKKAMEEQMKNAQAKIGEKKSELFKDKNSPTFDPSGSNITIVEFFDYSCGYCKKANEVLSKLFAEDKKIKIVYKEYPVLGPNSEELSHIALAVNMIQPKLYKEFHDKLMSSKVSSKEEALKIAEEVGIKADKITTILDKEKEQISKIIEANRKLASEIGANGTPAFIIGDEFIPGMLDLETLKAKISQARKKK
ncbi:MAG: DsbA family protein [Rickettsiales bacterium]|nr:DsbA family protein [Rickettsiales bacterium]